MSDWAIKVSDLGKRYRIGERQPYFRLTEALERAVTSPLRRLRRSGSPRKPARDMYERPADATHRLEVESDTAETFWALRHVSFEVPRGEVLGVIGRNGAGKSTLLKLIARITEPTEGEIRMRGRVASLLEVGTGFHPELTGRENVYLNGTILGMTHREVKAKFEEIVDFSGVEAFLDTPVKRYSSGMRVRLAFAVAAHLDPEILLIDEVLAVGDAEFQKKCLGKMEDVANSGRTVFFVSHHLAAVRTLCHRVIWLHAGGVEADGETRSVVDRYLKSTAGRAASWSRPTTPPHQAQKMSRIERITVAESSRATEQRLFWTGDRIGFLVTFVMGKATLEPKVGVVICSSNGEALLNANNRYQVPIEGPQKPVRGGQCKIDLGSVPLMAGTYSASFWLGDETGDLDQVAHAVTFEVFDRDIWGRGQTPPGVSYLWWPARITVQ